MKKFLLLIILSLVVGCTSTNTRVNNLKTNTEIVLQSEKELNKSLREVAIEKKVYKGKIAYVAGETTPFTGVFTSRYIGHLLYFEEYKNGLLDGAQVWFGDDGNIGMRKYFVSGKQVGNQITYYPNGNIRSIFPFKDGKVEGTIEWYNRNGLLFDTSEIIDGTGRYIVYWNNGKIKEIGNLTKHKKTGTWKEFNQEGEIEKEIQYSNKGTILKQKWYK